MIDDPVAKASENSTKPNSDVAHRVRSAASREQCMPRIAAWARNSTTKSRSATASMLLGLGAVKPEIARERLAVDGEGGAREGGGAQRHHVDARAPVAEARAIALEHEDVGEQVVGQQHRLGALQVRVAGHRRLAVLLGLGDERALHVHQSRVHVVEDVPEIEPLVQRDLIVAGAAGVELAAHRPRQLDEAALHVHVDVLELAPEREGAALELAADPVEARQQALELRLGDQLRPRERARPRRASGQIVGPEPPVEGQGRGEGFGGRIGPGGEAPGPGLARGRTGGGHEAPARPAAAAGTGGTRRSAAISAMMRRVASSRSVRAMGPRRARPKWIGSPNRTASGRRRGR